MNIKRLLLATGVVLTITSVPIHAADVTPSDAIDGISNVAAALGTFEFVQPSSTLGTSGSLTATDFMTLTIANNNAAGYDIDIEATNGKLKGGTAALGTKEGLEIDYEIACDAYVDEEGAAVSAFTATNLTTTVTELYSHSSPDEATVNQTPDCDMTLTSGEDLDEKLADTYSETLTITITND